MFNLIFIVAICVLYFVSVVINTHMLVNGVLLLDISQYVLFLFILQNFMVRFNYYMQNRLQMSNHLNC